MKAIRNTKSTLGIAASIALLLLGAGVLGQAAPPTDAVFIQQVHGNGMAEVALADLAAKRASKSEVKAFAARLKDDHGRANADVKRLAGAHDIALSAELNVDQKATSERLSKLDGSEFDRAYIDEMVANHRKGVETFTAKTSSGADDVKAFAAGTLPVLKEHLQVALDLQRQLAH